jgi:hypothetical protein
MPRKGTKTLTVPESLYDEVKQIADQASVRHEILKLFDQYKVAGSERTALIQQVLSEISKHEETSLLALKGLLLYLLFKKRKFTKSEAFAVLDNVLAHL